MNLAFETTHTHKTLPLCVVVSFPQIGSTAQAPVYRDGSPF